ncbi:MAG: hypothetical protein IT555_20090, partial [Acetobacteraceae bacterium]|nr:hypothetical protein [Acetobacteraceae bacterium]
MPTVRARPDTEAAPRLRRWLAPALLLAIAAALAPLWWRATAPPTLATVRPWRDPAGRLLVPATSLRPPFPARRVEAPGAATLFVLRDGRARITRVQLGTLHGGVAEVRAGLDDTALLIAAPPFGLEDMHPVTAKP